MTAIKILIKGAGDLATGIAWRLHRCGCAVLMTEIERPTTVRRTVAFSSAVYEGRAEVEGVTARLVQDVREAWRVIDDGKIPVLVDPPAACKAEFRPDVLVDAVIAKKNIGTKRTDAPLVIGVGPGFCAGQDCDLAVETMRGHTLGKVICSPQYRRSGGDRRFWKGTPDPCAGRRNFSAPRIHRRPGGERADCGGMRRRADPCADVRRGAGDAERRAGSGSGHEMRRYRRQMPGIPLLFNIG